MNSILRGTLAAALVACAASRAGAQAQGETAAFVVTLGSDTLAVEKYTRTGDRLEGQMVSRSPRTTVRSYTAVLNPDGSVQRMEMTSSQPGSGQPAVTAAAQFTADSAFTRVQRGDSVYSFRIAAPRAVPLVNLSHVFYEQAMMQARAMRRDTVTLALVPIGANQSYPMLVSAVGADSMRLANVAGVQRVATDARGRLLGLNGIESTAKFIVHRVPDVDVDAFATEFARRDAAHQGMGPLSPRDSAVADFGGAHLAVDYGRPFKRGRVVFGNVVPWGQVWRTGANAATGFTTTRDLTIGGVSVPAGRYTLWTLPTQSGWKLIVNRQTGQWGTEYDAAQDLARIDMQTRRIDTPLEEFTVRLEPQAGGGVLRLQWDDLEAFVPITVK
ncbi:DUF2911 domain-containing protein [Longimicrobium sp.]|uniref:DUF2911 domain-containing protein n=1 Tax=Longimicrobium sp. TaxID=2029185 RepID=UPI002B6A13EC|nr:DUF2911 domain-containing protein [Longimicrobium sp.]HSU15101.1 DUF2911 domain-containing protein [Longimicrobium sp.]